MSIALCIHYGILGAILLTLLIQNIVMFATGTWRNIPLFDLTIGWSLAGITIIGYFYALSIESYLLFWLCYIGNFGLAVLNLKRIGDRVFDWV